MAAMPVQVSYPAALDEASNQSTTRLVWRLCLCCVCADERKSAKLQFACVCACVRRNNLNQATFTRRDLERTPRASHELYKESHGGTAAVHAHGDRVRTSGRRNREHVEATEASTEKLNTLSGSKPLNREARRAPVMTW
jgi:hypothetical protein